MPKEPRRQAMTTKDGRGIPGMNTEFSNVHTLAGILWVSQSGSFLKICLGSNSLIVCFCLFLFFWVFFFSPVYPKVPVSSVETLKELQDHLICSRCSPRAEAWDRATQGLPGLLLLNRHCTLHSLWAHASQIVRACSAVWFGLLV